MKYIELKDKNLEELKSLLIAKKKLQFTLKHKLKTMQLSNPKELMVVRKDIAKINTAINAIK